MSNQSIVVSLPAHLMVPELMAANDALGAGLQTGNFLPSVSIKGKTFRFRKGKEEFIFPEYELEVVLLAARPTLTKLYYPKAYDPANPDEQPTCQSDFHTVPNPGVSEPQAASCATCKWDQWGSKISITKAKVKACSDSKYLVLTPIHPDIPKMAMALQIPPTTFKPFKTFFEEMKKNSIPLLGAVIRMAFNKETEYPQLDFKFVRFVTPEELAECRKLAEAPDVVEAVTPPEAPAYAPPVVAPATAPPPAAPSNPPSFADRFTKEAAPVVAPDTAKPEPPTQPATEEAPAPPVTTVEGMKGVWARWQENASA